jgi:hypothetical protein
MSGEILGDEWLAREEASQFEGLVASLNSLRKKCNLAPRVTQRLKPALKIRCLSQR